MSRRLILGLTLTLLAVATIAPTERPRTRCWCMPRHTSCGPAVLSAEVQRITHRRRGGA